MENLISLEEAIEASRSEARKWFNFVNPSLASLLSLLNFDRRYLKAEGIYVWDEEGKKYLDFLGGYSALNLGHNHPRLVKAMRKVESLPNILQATLNPLAGALAKNLAQITPGNLEISFFCNSGAEAVEGALKLARAASGKKGIIYAENSFHGKTFGALSVTGRDKYQKPFKPLLAPCYRVPYGNLESLQKIILKERDIAALILEPIQGEGGIILPPKGYFQEVRKLCQKHKVFLIVDEIQTGFGRTGKMFACEEEKIEPDILTLAKSFGGGIMPLGVYITTKKIWSVAYGGTNNCLLHTSTFGNNSRACAAGLATIEVIYEEGLVKAAREKGAYFLSRLEETKDRYPMIKEVRGRGLMVGIEFYQPTEGWLKKLSKGFVNKLSEEYFASMIAAELLNEHKIITAYTLNNPNVIRMQPPLTVSRKELDHVVEALDKVCKRYKGFFRMALKTGKTVLGKVFEKR